MGSGLLGVVFLSSLALMMGWWLLMKLSVLGEALSAEVINLSLSGDVDNVDLAINVLL